MSRLVCLKLFGYFSGVSIKILQVVSYWFLWLLVPPLTNHKSTVNALNSHVGGTLHSFPLVQRVETLVNLRWG